MKFINWLLGREELTVEVHIHGTYSDEDIKRWVRLWDEIRTERSCKCTLFFKGL